MKFSSILLISLPIVLATPIAKPFASPQGPDDVDMDCFQKYCPDYVDASSGCAESTGVDLLSSDITGKDADKWAAYLKCYCDSSAPLYESCLNCYTTDSYRDEFASIHDAACNTNTTPGDTSGDSTGTDDSTTGTDDDKKDTTTTGTSEKKNDAGTLKSGMSFKMAGAMVVAGGVIAAM